MKFCHNDRKSYKLSESDQWLNADKCSSIPSKNLPYFVFLPEGTISQGGSRLPWPSSPCNHSFGALFISPVEARIIKCLAANACFWHLHNMSEVD
jgi:hypothetical protein